MAISHLPLENKFKKDSILTVVDTSIANGTLFLRDTQSLTPTQSLYYEKLKTIGLTKTDRDTLWNFLNLVHCNTPFIRTYCMYNESPIIFNAVRVPNTLKETLKSDLKYYISFDIQEVRDSVNTL